MAVTFKEENHLYESLDPNDNIIWTSVTKFLDNFKEEFDAVAISEKCAKNKKSKWFGLKPEEIRKIWKGEATRASEAGTFYHDQREQDVINLDTIERNGVAVPIIRPIYDNKIKQAPDQRVMEGIYPEHLVYLKSAGLCGQADRVEVVKDVIDIIDYKTNKEIKKRAYASWDGTVKKMKDPIAHLDDCNFIHYSLQLSIYLYIMLKHNPRLKPGKLILQHVKFEVESKDQYGYPKYKRNDNGDFVVKEVIPYQCAYLKDEVRSMIKWFNDLKEK